MSRFPHLSLLSACIIVGYHGAAYSQSVDYAALQATMGEPVTTSVTGKPQRASETPASVTIITSDQIAHSPARDVPGLLKSYAGVDVNRWTAGQSDVAVRGGVQAYNARLLVLVDGRQVYLDHYGMTDWNLLGVQLDEIQQIELVRGPASALFGFNAASAVVNIITVDPLERRLVSATAEVGTHGYDRISGVVALPLGQNIGLKVSAGQQRENERDIPAELYQPPRAVDPRRTDVKGTLEAALDQRTRLSVEGAYADNRQLEFLPSQLITEQHFQVKNAGVTVEHDTGWGSVSARAYANWLDVGYGVGLTTGGPSSVGGLTFSELHNRTAVAQGSALVRLGLNNTARIGIEYRNNRLRADTLFSSGIDYNVVSASGMFDLHPADQVAVTLAGRVDHLMLGQSGAPREPSANSADDYDRAFTEASFNAAVLIDLRQGGQLRINGGRGVQSPSLIAYGYRLPLVAYPVPYPVLLTGDPAIKPVPVWSAEIGYVQTLAPWLTVDGTAFYTRTTGAIASPGNAPNFELRTVGSPILVTRFANVGDYETYGIEIAVKGVITPRLRWQANYTLTETDQHFSTVGDQVSYPFAPDATTPRHKANATLDYDGMRWFGSVVGRYTSASRQFAFTAVQQLLLVDVSQAVALDAKLGLRLRPGVSVSLAGENLTGADGATGSPIPADTRIRVGLSLSL